MKFRVILGALGLVAFASAQAQDPYFQVGDANAASVDGQAVPGGTAVNIPVELFLDGATTNTHETDFTFDNANLTIDVSNCGTGADQNCAIVGGNILRLGETCLIGGCSISGGSFGTIAVSVNAGAPLGNYTIAAGAEVSAVPTNTQNGVDGIVEAVAAPAPNLQFNPASQTINADLNSSTGNSATTDLENNGSAPSTNTVCTEGDGTDNVSFSGFPTGSTIADGSAVTITASCDTSSVYAGDSDTLTCTNAEGENEVFTATCNVSAQPEMPAYGSGGNATIAPGSTGIVVINFVDNEPASTGYNITGCTLDTPDDAADDNDGNFTIDPAQFPIAVAPGAPGQVEVGATGPTGGVTATNSITCTTDSAGTPTVGAALAVVGIMPVVPTLSQWALILLAMVLAGFGAYQVRRRSGLVA